MSIFVTFIIFILGIFGGLISANFTDAQSKAGDTQAKAEIHVIYQRLEEHFNEKGYYPVAEAVSDSKATSGDSLFPGIDAEVMFDQNNKWVNEGDYSYQGHDCSRSECKKYTLSTKLNDGTTYTKNSLN